MAVDPDFRLWLEDTLGRIRPVRTRPRFGGLGIWSGELFFALADDEEDGGSSRFRPYGDDGPAMDHWKVPADVLEYPGLLTGRGPWVSERTSPRVRPST